MTGAQLEGHCLCGNVTYQGSGEPIATALCHCEDCQRQTGSTFSIVVLVDRSQLNIEGDTLATFKTVGTEGGAERERKFCSNCGSPIVTFLADKPDLAIIKAGTLNDRSWLSPQLEVWCDSGQTWMDTSAERGRFPTGLPA